MAGLPVLYNVIISLYRCISTKLEKSMFPLQLYFISSSFGRLDSISSSSGRLHSISSILMDTSIYCDTREYVTPLSHPLVEHMCERMKKVIRCRKNNYLENGSALYFVATLFQRADDGGGCTYSFFILFLPRTRPGKMMNSQREQEGKKRLYGRATKVQQFYRCTFGINSEDAKISNTTSNAGFNLVNYLLFVRAEMSSIINLLLQKIDEVVSTVARYLFCIHFSENGSTRNLN